MEVRPLHFWIFSTVIALVGALLGILFEGTLDNTLLAGMKGDRALVGEGLSTVIAALLAAALGGLISPIIFVGYQWFSDKRK